MTSSSINDISGLSYAKGTGAFGVKSVNAADELVGSFQNAMNLAKDNSFANTSDHADVKSAADVNLQSAQNTSAGSVVKTEYDYSVKGDTKGVVKNADRANDTNQTSDVKEDDKAESADATKKSESTTVSETDEKEIEEKASELEDKIVKKIAETLNVSEEDVKAAMEALGFTFADLADQANLASVVNEINADEGSLALLTDENMFSNIVSLAGEITELIDTEVNAIAEDLDLDFSAVLEKMTEEPDLAQEVNVLADADEEVSEPKIVIESSDEHMDEVNLKENDHTVVQSEKETTQTEQSFDQNDTNQGLTDNSENQSMLQTPVNLQNVPQPEMVSEVETYQESMVDTQDIIDQIVDKIRVNNGSDFSEIEMALNPASLGNIHLQIESKAGVITANITAENETVRDALLVQAMILKDELNEQGMKVEAIEVTVGSHEFEQNMQKESGDEAKQLFEQQVKKQTRRRIMISGMDEAEEMLADESLSEADRIQIDMMAKSGSTMNVLT